MLIAKVLKRSRSKSPQRGHFLMKLCGNKEDDPPTLEIRRKGINKITLSALRLLRYLCGKK